MEQQTADDPQYGINTNENTMDDTKEEGLLAASGEDDGADDASSMARDGLTALHLAAYSVGHFCNDLCAAMWFVYLAWYLQRVVGLDEHTAGLCMLSGQLADGLATPIVGLASDKFDTRCGKRWPWFFAGTLLVAPCFAGIFAYPEFINTRPVGNPVDILEETASWEAGRNAWYITLPALFNIGWASVQISHMAIVNSLSASNRRRDRMVNNRNGFTYGANIFILTLALLLFAFLNPAGKEDGETKDAATAQLEFRIMTYVGLGLGLCTSVFYMVVIREVRLSKEAEECDIKYKAALGAVSAAAASEVAVEAADGEEEGKDWRAWLGEGTFYVHGLVYTLVRMAVGVTMTIQPFYLQLVTGFGLTENLTLDQRGCVPKNSSAATSADPTPPELALVPLISYVLSLIFSVFVQQAMTRRLRNRFLPMLVAILIIVATSLPLLFLGRPSDGKLAWPVYPLVGFQGIGLAIMLNTATSLISDVIGNDTANSAFVYGCYSLLEKVANGGLLYFIIAEYSACPGALKWVVSIIPIACAVLAYLLTWIGNKYFSHKMAKITGIAP